MSNVATTETGVQGQSALTIGRRSYDFKLLRRAVINRWPVPEESAKLAIECANAALRDPDASHTEHNAASKFLLACDMAALKAMKDQEDSERQSPQVNIQVNGDAQIAAKLTNMTDEELRAIAYGHADETVSSDDSAGA